MRDRHPVGAVVEHEEPRGAESRAGTGHGLVGERCVQLLSGEQCVRDAGQHSGDPAAAARSAADDLDRFAQRGTERHLADAVVLHRAADRHDNRAGRSFGTDGSEPVRALREDRRQVRHRLEVVDERRRQLVAAFGRRQLERARRGRTVADLVDPVTPRWRDAGERLAPVDHFEQRRLLAVEIGIGSELDVDGHAVGPAGRHDLVDRRLQARAFTFERRFQAEDDPVRPEGRRGDERAFDCLVRVVPQERPVLEGARFAFGRVHDDGCRQLRRAMTEHRSPLHARGEPGAAPSPEPGGLDLGDHGFGTHVPGGIETPTPAPIDPVLQGRHRLAGQKMQMLTHRNTCSPRGSCGHTGGRA